MNELVRPELVQGPVSLHRVTFAKSELGLIRDMNSILTDREFDQFISTSVHLGLSPLKRQICSIVFNAKRAQKRSMAIVTTIHGLRAIADRSGDYRPDDNPARYETDTQLRNPNTNPHGIVSCTVTPYLFKHGEWHAVPGQVWWDEIAPIKKWDDVAKLDSRTPWPSRPRAQIAKCAEADALRKGWPEDLTNVYVEEEVDRARILDITPAQAAAEAKKERLLTKIGVQGAITVDLWDGNGLTTVPVDQFHSRICEFLHKNSEEDRSGCLTFLEQNRVAFKAFFAHDKAAALDLKKKFEKLREQEEADNERT